MFDTWQERFTYIIECGDSLSAECPQALLPYRIAGCQSRSCFMTETWGDTHLHVAGWSNSCVMRGLIALILEMFEGVTMEELRATDIDFHTKSGLTDNLTPQRRAALAEIINRIKGC
jgi:cysteine desulfuration protein SufE